MQLVYLEQPIHIHTKLSKAVKRAADLKALRMEVPTNVIINSILAAALTPPRTRTTNRKKTRKK